LTLPIVGYFLRDGYGSGDIFGTGAGILNIFFCVIVFACVFIGVCMFMMVAYRDTMAVRLMRTVLTLVVSVGTAIAITFQSLGRPRLRPCGASCEEQWQTGSQCFFPQARRASSS
jgi:hypothetical protein